MTDSLGFQSIATILRGLGGFSQVRFGPDAVKGPPTGADTPRANVLPDTWQVQNLFDSADAQAYQRTVNFRVEITTKPPSDGTDPIDQLGTLAASVEAALNNNSLVCIDPMTNTLTSALPMLTRVNSGAYDRVPKNYPEIGVSLRGSFSYLTS